MKKNGLKALIKKYRKKFRIPENIDHYAEDDFRRAEKKYLKFCLTTGGC